MSFVRYFLLAFGACACGLFGQAAHADVAGPEVSKAAACTMSDGPSTYRLQVTVDGKSRATEYFYKESGNLYYVVFSDWRKDASNKARSGASARQVRLYRHACSDGKILRYPINFKDVVPGSVDGPTGTTRYFRRDVNLARITWKSGNLFTIEFEVSQTGIGMSLAYDAKKNTAQRQHGLADTEN